MKTLLLTGSPPLKHPKAATVTAPVGTSHRREAQRWAQVSQWYETPKWPSHSAALLHEQTQGKGSKQGCGMSSASPKAKNAQVTLHKPFSSLCPVISCGCCRHCRHPAANTLLCTALVYTALLGWRLHCCTPCTPSRSFWSSGTEFDCVQHREEAKTMTISPTTRTIARCCG